MAVIKAKLDRNSVKKILDKTVIEIVKSNGYVGDSRQSISKLRDGTFLLAIALFAHFLIAIFAWKLNLFGLFVQLSLRASRKFAGYFVQMNVFLFTDPLTGSCNTTGLALSSKLARCSDLYTLTIESENHESRRLPVKLTRSFTEWFASDGVLMEDLFRKDVGRLLNEYAKGRHLSNWDRCWKALLELSILLPLMGLGMMIYL